MKTPPVAKKPKQIITSEQFDKVYTSITEPTMRLLVETDIESGLRWGELTELRVKDFDQATDMLTVARVVVQLLARDRPDGVSFIVKDYPKDKEWRQVKLDRHLADKLTDHIRDHHLAAGDLLFEMPQPDGPARRRRPLELPDPVTLGMTEPNEKGRQYLHGTASAYGPGHCRCRHCRDAVAAYRAARRAAGKDSPRTPRTVATDGHIPAGWFRKQVWYPAIAAAGIGVHITPHGMRHAHASWLLAGGADLQVVKERLGHGSITTTEKYLHTLPGAQDAALTALTAIRGDRSRSGEIQPRENGPQTGPAGEREQGPRDAELAELRSMVTQFRSLLGAIGDSSKA